MDLDELRDLVIVIWGILGIIVLLVTLLVVILVGFAARGLLSGLNTVVKTQLSPTLDSARAVVDDVRGTTSFITDTAVSPFIRMYGLIGGLRRGFLALIGLTQRRPRKG